MSLLAVTLVNRSITRTHSSLCARGAISVPPIATTRWASRTAGPTLRASLTR